MAFLASQSNELRAEFINAIMQNNLGEVKRILSSVSKEEIKELLIDTTANDGSTPLHWAAFNGHKEGAVYLIEQGAAVDATNKYGNTPLNVAAGKGHKQ